MQDFRYHAINNKINGSMYQSKHVKDDIFDATILIIDDMEFDLNLLANSLKSKGFKNVLLAHSGNEGIELLEKYDPDLVVLDLLMTDGTGYEFCNYARSKKQFFMLPIIVETCLDKPEQKRQAFECGATDLVNKPFNPDELFARVFVHLERYRFYHQLHSLLKNVEYELQEAKTMQNSILPQKELIEAIEQEHNIKIYSYFKNSFEIGGDIWGVFKLNDKIGFHITDFSGHGFTAAMNTFRFHTLISEMEYSENPGEMLEFLNNSLKKLLTSGQFATCFLGVIDPKQRVIKYSPAGSPYPLLISKKNNLITKIDSSGFPIGIKLNVNYANEEIPYTSGDCLLLCSDAFFETSNETTQNISVEELMQVIYAIDITGLSDTEISTKIFETVKNLYISRFGEVVSDDLTINLYQLN